MAAADLGSNFRGGAKWNLRLGGILSSPKGLLDAAPEANAFRAICLNYLKMAMSKKLASARFA